MANRGKDRRPAFTHHGGVSFHHVERGSDIRREVDLIKEDDSVGISCRVLAARLVYETDFVDDKEIRLGIAKVRSA